MELNEAARRIVGQHWKVIVAFLVAGVLVGTWFAQQPRTYTASTRLALDTQDPRSDAESRAIADTTRAIATSPTQINDALARARVTDRGPAEVAKRVSVSALGTSGIVKLSVSDQNPQTAAAIANALASQTIQVRLEVSQGRAKQLLEDLNARIAKLERRISKADPITRPSLIEQRSILESERVSLLTSEAQRPRPSIISQANPPDHADPSLLVQYLVLGALLGMILGVGAAALIETVRPTVVGGDALAREFGAPHLGTVPNDAGSDPYRLAGVAARLTLAARTAGVEDVSLMGIRNQPDLEALSEQLESIEADADLELASSAAATGRRKGPGAKNRPPEPPRRYTVLSDANRPGLRVHPFRVQERAPTNPSATGLALILPNAVKKAELRDVKGVLGMMRWPLLGVITSAPRHSRGGRQANLLAPARTVVKREETEAGAETRALANGSGADHAVEPDHEDTQLEQKRWAAN